MPLNMTVYTQDRCQQCIATKRWLDKRGVAYEVVHVAADDTQTRDALRELNIMQMPAVVVRGEGGYEDHWGGFRTDKLEEHVTALAAA